MKKYICNICGFVYEEAAGIPSAGIAPGTKWEDLPENWTCPICGASKENFQEQKAASPAAESAPAPLEADGDLRALSAGELSALCSNLARGCEKQYKNEEAALYTQLAEYFQARTPAQENAAPEQLWNLVRQDLETASPVASSTAKAEPDRGALRALVWSEKVSRILDTLLARYQKEGGGFLENTSVYVCDICGFVFVGENPPAICPVCKVPNWKFVQMERR